MSQWIPKMSGFENQLGLCPGEPKDCGKTKLCSWKAHRSSLTLSPCTETAAWKAPGSYKRETYFRACATKGRFLVDLSPVIEVLLGILFVFTLLFCQVPFLSLSINLPNTLDPSPAFLWELTLPNPPTSTSASKIAPTLPYLASSPNRHQHPSEMAPARGDKPCTFMYPQQSQPGFRQPGFTDSQAGGSPCPRGVSSSCSQSAQPARSGTSPIYQCTHSTQGVTGGSHSGAWGDSASGPQIPT